VERSVVVAWALRYQTGDSAHLMVAAIDLPARPPITGAPVVRNLFRDGLWLVQRTRSIREWHYPNGYRLLY